MLDPARRGIAGLGRSVRPPEGQTEFTSDHPRDSNGARHADARCFATQHRREPGEGRKLFLQHDELVGQGEAQVTKIRIRQADHGQERVRNLVRQRRYFIVRPES